MGGQRWAGCIVLGFVLLPAIVVAQKFQEPNKEELQMTSDPKAPGAPAVYFFREKITDNNSHFISEYARIKVLSEKGKEWATVEVPYFGSGAPPRIEARTIHPDGSVIPLAGSGPELLVQSNREGRTNMRVFNLPAVDVGSILEYRWTLPMGEGVISGTTNDMQAYLNSALAGEEAYWDVQTALYVHKEHFHYDPLSDLERNVIGNQHITHYANGEIANYMLYSAHLPAGAKVTVSPRHDYDLVVQDVPAVSHEEWAPPELGRNYAVQFFYSPYLAADAYWSSEGKRWQKDIDRLAEPADTLKAAAAQITAGAATEEAKARKLYDAVQGLTNTSFNGGGQSGADPSLNELKTAGQVWAARTGSRNEIALTYLALARAAGLQAGGMSIADRDRRIFDSGLLSLSQLTVELVILHIDGKDVFVDPGEKLLPFGQLRWSHTLCGGLAETALGVSTTEVTPPNLTKDAITAHAADLQLDPAGNVTGTLQLVANGPAALGWRQMGLSTDANEVRARIAQSLRQSLPSSLNSEITAIKGLDTSEGYLQVTAKVSGTLGSVTGKRVLLPAFFLSSATPARFAAEETRELPLDLHYAEQVIDDVVYHLPPGYSVESAPQAVQLPWPDHVQLVVKVTPDPAKNTLDVRHTVARAFVILPPKEYPALHDYYQKIAVNDQQQVVLAPSGK